MLEVGQLLDGKYKILNKVGQGGVSICYLAVNKNVNTPLAAEKFCNDGILNFKDFEQDLIAETDIPKKIRHPRLPSIVDIINTDDSFIIVSDCVKGNLLDETIRDFGAQPQEAVIDWAKQLCDVLGYLHSLNPPIIYRDMKPSNVVLQPDISDEYPFGKVFLKMVYKTIDDALNNAFESSVDEWYGTPTYAAPEQFGGNGQTNARTDIFALGKTMHYLVTGIRPEDPATATGYTMLPIRQISHTLSKKLEKIIVKCTQLDPKRRYQSTDELLHDLERVEKVLRLNPLMKFFIDR